MDIGIACHCLVNIVGQLRRARLPSFFSRAWRDETRAVFPYSDILKYSFFGALLAGAIFLPQGCAWTRSGQSGRGSQNSAVEAVIKPVKVTTAGAVTRRGSFSINATGSFIADEISDVAPGNEGQVVATPVSVGDFVRKGAVIARLDDRDAKLRLEQALASERQAEAALRQARESLTQGKSDQGLAGAEAAMEAARAKTAIARNALSDTIVRAPFDGHISDRPAALGEHAAPSTRIATLQRINPIKLRLQLPEADAALARVGTKVAAMVAAYPGRQFEGRVIAINPALDPASRTVSIEARIDNPEILLRPGMFATAQLLPPGGEEAVFIPSQAVINDPATNSSRVYVLEGDIARVRVIETGTRSGSTEDGMVRITSGLSGAETVITNNLDQLFDGAKVILP